jgi:LysW-gamma-L-lysine carboxypeptidase
MQDIEFLEQCLRIPSLSGQERHVAEFLTAQMAQRGFDKTTIDDAGNAVGVIGSGKRQLVLLGHMDTVGGDVPVRYEGGKLYGRGAVDAKGPLCAFVLAAAAAKAVLPADWQIVVLGCTEEEAASSRGAHYAATQYAPEACVIGEPSSSGAVTLGYMGRILIFGRFEQESQHTSRPGATATETAVSLWNYIDQHVAGYNCDKTTSFERIIPSLRAINSGGDGNTEWCDLTIAARLPLAFPPEAIRSTVDAWEYEQQQPREGDLRSPVSWKISFGAEERAYRSARDTDLVRAFVSAIRAEGMRPAFKTKSGTADFNVVGPRWNVPIVAFGPGDSTLDHTPHEHVDIDEFDRGVRVLTNAIKTLCADA